MEKSIKSVFKRYEQKYLLDIDQLFFLEKRLNQKMKEDLFGIQTICNIYFDTDEYSIIKASIEESNYKEKLRLRSYGVPKKEDMIYAEIKRKADGVVYKRRISLNAAQANDYFVNHRRPINQGQILNEIDWFLRLYNPSPKVFIAYDRKAYLDNKDPNLRVTFDKNIRFRFSQLDLTKGAFGLPLLTNGKTLMEIKTINALPLWFSSLLSELKVYPVSFSKYGTCYREHIIKNYEKGEVTYA